jgi:hypothetical protein
MGDETLVFLEYGGRGSLVSRADAESKVAVGDRVGFEPRRDRVLFFAPPPARGSFARSREAAVIPARS